MAGEIKAGRSTFIGNAGEYYVVAELLNMGVIAALAPRNTPAFDVLATNGGRAVQIRVKTKSERYDIWQWAAKKDGSIFKELGGEQDFTVLVNLAVQREDLAFFVVSTKTLNQWLVNDFEKWVRTPGKGGRPHDPNNKKRHLPYSKNEQQLVKYRDSWDSLWK